MIKHSAILFLGTLALVAAHAQPVISSQGPVNAASYRTPGLSASGIAQGSAFTIFGTGLGPSSYAQANSFPLPNTLAGTSVTVTIGTTVTPAIVILAFNTQVNAILPSSTPVGTGSVTVTYNNQTSTPAPVQVVASAFGIYAYNSSGSGQAIATDTSYQLNTIIHAFHPGDYVVLWGTGLGPIATSDAEPPPAGNLSVPVTMHVGNTTAAVDYSGRAPCCSGLDQVVFQVPAGIEGCYVPIGVETAGAVGNIATIAVSASGNTCTDSILGQDLVNQLASGQKVDFGYIRLESYLTQNLGISGNDYGVATFSELDPAAAGLAEYGVSSGYCYAVDCSNGCATSVTPNGSLSDSSPGQLDAGTLAMTYGTATYPLTHYYSDYFVELSSIYGTRVLWGDTSYPVTGTGGANVAPFSVSDLTADVNLQFTNVSEYSAVPRVNGLTLHWTGGNPALQNGEVTIGAYSSNSSFTNYAYLQCTAPLAAGQFSIPGWVLSTLPASGTYGGSGVTLPLGFVSIGQYNKPTVFSAQGLDRGIITDIFYYQQQVSFQ